MEIERMFPRTALLAGLTVLTGVGGLATELKIQLKGSERLTRKTASYQCDGKGEAMGLPSLDSHSPSSIAGVRYPHCHAPRAPCEGRGGHSISWPSRVMR